MIDNLNYALTDEKLNSVFRETLKLEDINFTELNKNYNFYDLRDRSVGKTLSMIVLLFNNLFDSKYQDIAICGRSYEDIHYVKCLMQDIFKENSDFKEIKKNNKKYTFKMFGYERTINFFVLSDDIDKNYKCFRGYYFDDILLTDAFLFDKDPSLNYFKANEKYIKNSYLNMFLRK